MGAFDAKRQDEITIRDEKNWEEGEYVTARTIVRSGDEEWVLNQQMQIMQPKGNRKQRRASGFQKQQNADIELKSQLGATNRLWVQKMLTGWTFTAGGLPVPFEKSGENELADRRMGKIMQQLDQSYIDHIFAQIMAAQPKEAQPEEDEDDEEEDEEEGSPFFESVCDSTDGEMPVRTMMELRNGVLNMEETKHRNFLAKS